MLIEQLGSAWSIWERLEARSNWDSLLTTSARLGGFLVIIAPGLGASGAHQVILNVVITILV